MHNKIEHLRKQNLELTSIQKKLEELVLTHDSNAWPAGRLVDDRILDSYFETFGENLSNLQSKSQFLGPSLTQLVRFGDVADVFKQ